MFESKKWIVITTINKPTKAIEVISKLCKEKKWNAVVVGDKKTPDNWSYENIVYLSVKEQIEFDGIFSELLPYNHYCRKNIGYLYAIKNGAELILETDDDNIPYDDFGNNIQRINNGLLVNETGWINIYKNYTDTLIWPRGLPLNKIHDFSLPDQNDFIESECLIQQYLADEDPDVDAIYRLLFKDPVVFNKLKTPLFIGKNSWVPFNSQNTLFFKEAFSLLYLPSFVSFRMTDIWRSFVAQAVLKSQDKTFSFQNATVKQIRNDHNLMKDFSDEVVGYLENNRIKNILMEEIQKHDNKSLENLPKTAKRMWMRLVEENIIPEKEIDLINQWYKNFNA